MSETISFDCCEYPMKVRDETISDFEISNGSRVSIKTYLEKYNNAKVYEGKYFKEVNESHPSSIRTIFVYGIDKDCNPMSLCVSYFIGEKTHFEIEYYGHFHPKKWNDSEDWIEITEEEWRGHYNEVQKIINSVLTTN